jgi:PAS domain-containing protein
LTRVPRCFHDIARKRTEERLLETTQTLQSLVQLGPVAIHIVDLESKPRLWNPAAERKFGSTEAEFRGRPLADFEGPGGPRPS